MGSEQENGARNAPLDDGRSGRDGSRSGNAKAGWILLGLAALMAAGSIGYNLYEASADAGAPANIASAEPSLDELRAAAEAAPDDANAWSDLAYAHFDRGEFGDAGQAYERAVAIDDDEAVLWSALGESRVYASERDPLPADALEAFERAIALDPGDPRARYFLAVKKDLDGDHEGSIAAWMELLSDSPVGAPWENDLVRTIQQVAAINDIDIEDDLAAVLEARAPGLMMPGSGEIAGAAASATVRGPNAQQIAEASRLAPGEQRSMAEGMVAQLEARLVDEPDNLDGWVMLMRSRMALGERGRARDALNSAIAANPGEEAELRTQAEQLGIR